MDAVDGGSVRFDFDFDFDLAIVALDVDWPLWRDKSSLPTP